MPNLSEIKYCPVCATLLIEKELFNARRLACENCGFIFFLNPKVVVVVVIQRNGRFLLGKRNIDPGKGKWGFTGGYVDQNESVEEAALREVKEETNLDIQLEGLIGVYSQHGSPHIIIAYQGRILDNNIQNLTPQVEEVSELGFFAPDTLPDLAFPSNRSILRDLLRRNPRS
ncbi:NUDIX domain-containing protein [Ktedonospora formicarum]|uniref:Nudix hydrolase domain-containing protein n=1 Tax=Ktedonospora formicarum TaxID=2778364 RepID=A0A8J3MS84_9CHLR|nr:NUDIX domain-containing protein [Ktedonospora formicarum]GHO44338.1 hypothetical protein KSX_25010 [Ktedonospora formicarum]